MKNLTFLAGLVLPLVLSVPVTDAAAAATVVQSPLPSFQSEINQTQASSLMQVAETKPKDKKGDKEDKEEEEEELGEDDC